MCTQSKGFIALYTILGISSMLLVYVTMSSESVFDFIHARDKFISTRGHVERMVRCSDEIIDMIVRTQKVYQSACAPTQVIITQVDAHMYTFSFIIDTLYTKGTITHGLISHLQFFYISL